MLHRRRPDAVPLRRIAKGILQRHSVSMKNGRISLCGAKAAKNRKSLKKIAEAVVLRDKIRRGSEAN